MYQLELYANYALRDLLPEKMKMKMPEKIESGKGGTILLNFKSVEEREQFIAVCREFNFQNKIM
jgi:hypothetical protein